MTSSLHELSFRGCMLFKVVERQSNGVLYWHLSDVKDSLR